ncbi:hypothetical protein B0T16DRAFT_516307 [Cercophora newfieldiana]|uniref:RING-type domain-containing protein n=1 Tax=Cercophora newfieldiana TaxID=92897 RepID=A0AA39XYU1_9PEZI|nr:hypothetical protein B0T16DRAFT_516307 [Cercophora newfieldiana]
MYSTSAMLRSLRKTTANINLWQTHVEPEMENPIEPETNPIEELTMWHLVKDHIENPPANGAPTTIRVLCNICQVTHLDIRGIPESSPDSTSDCDTIPSSPGTVLPCGHMFCTPCITALFERFTTINDAKRMHAQCPTCRFSLRYANCSCLIQGIDIPTNIPGVESRTDKTPRSEFFKHVPDTKPTGRMGSEPFEMCAGCWALFSSENTEVAIVMTMLKASQGLGSMRWALNNIHLMEFEEFWGEFSRHVHGRFGKRGSGPADADSPSWDCGTGSGTGTSTCQHLDWDCEIQVPIHTESMRHPVMAVRKHSGMVQIREIGGASHLTTYVQLLEERLASEIRGASHPEVYAQWLEERLVREIGGAPHPTAYAQWLEEQLAREL